MMFETYVAYRTDEYSVAFRESMGITNHISKISFPYLSQKYIL